MALILADSPKAALEIPGKEEKNLMDMLYALLLLSQPIVHDKDQALRKWLPAHLLAMESLLVTAEEPRAVYYPSSGCWSSLHRSAFNAL